MFQHFIDKRTCGTAMHVRRIDNFFDFPINRCSSRSTFSRCVRIENTRKAIDIEKRDTSN